MKSLPKLPSIGSNTPDYKSKVISEDLYYKLGKNQTLQTKGRKVDDGNKLVIKKVRSGLLKTILSDGLSPNKFKLPQSRLEEQMTLTNN